jgi:hypothetical protein
MSGYFDDLKALVDAKYHHRHCRHAGDVSGPPDAICQRLLLARNPVLHNLGHGFHLCAALYGGAGRKTIIEMRFS